MIRDLASFGRQLGPPYRQQRQRQLLSLAVMVGVLALSIIVGLRPTPLVLLPGLAVVALVILTRWPELGLVGLVVSSMVLPFSVGTGTGTEIPANMLLIAGVIGIWAFNIITGNWDGEFRWSKPLLPLILFMSVAVLAFFSGLLPWFDFVTGASVPAQLGGLALFLFSGLVVLWMSQQLEDLRWLEVATWVFMALAGILFLSQLIPPLSILRPYFGRGLENGSLFWVWLAALTFAQLVFNRKLHPMWRLALLALLLTEFVIAYFINGDWKSGWVPPLVAVLAIVAIRWPRLGLMLGVVSLIPALDVLAGLIETDQYSYSTRLEAWELITEIVKVNPVLGVGPANYYYYTPLFPIRGYSVTYNSHNQYVDLIAQVGLLGMVFFVWFIAEVGKLGWRLRAYVGERMAAPGNTSELAFAEAYVYGAMGGLIGTVVAGMLGDWIIPFVYNVGFSGFRASVLGWVFLGGLVALAHRKMKPNSSPVSGSE